MGNNVAGTNVAKGVRDADASAEIDVYTDEPVEYYARPKLIDFIAGAVDEDSMRFYPRDWYVKNRINLHLSSKVDALDLAAKTVSVNGASHPYDKLVLATGSSSFVPPFKGLPKRGVYTLRTLADAKSIKTAASGSRQAIVIGGGLLGIETARALATSFPTLRITILEYAEHLLMRQLDHEGASMLQEWIEAMGAKVLTRAETDEVLGADSVSGVKLKDGRVVDGDLVVVSAGARANVGLARSAGLKVNRGVFVDSAMRTSDPNTFAVGDVVELDGKTWGIIPPALEQARVAAKTVLGLEAPPYKGTVPSNTLKVAGINLSSMGTVRSEHEPADPGFEEVRVKVPGEKLYKKFVIRDGRMVGAILLGTKKDWPKISKTISEGRLVGGFKERLSDPGFSFP